MPPRSALRPNGKIKTTLADRVRLEWSKFEAWLDTQRKEADVRIEGALHDLRLRMETTKRSLPKGFHPTLMKEYENEKRMIIDDKEERSVLVIRSRIEWEERLEKAGLKAEDWDPMTFAEQEAVRAALAGDSDEEEEEYVSGNELGPRHDTASHWNVTNTHQPTTHHEVPAIAKRFSESQRMNTLSPLPDLPEWFRSRTPNSVPPTPPETRNHKALMEAMSNGKLGTRYTGPVLIDDDSSESFEDADFAEFKMAIREQMIREFHEEAAKLEIDLVRKEHEVRLKADAIKALLSAHQTNMEELRRTKEEKRKEIVDAERTRRKADIRRRKTGQKDVTGMQQSNVRVENISLRKGSSQESGSYNAQFGQGKQPKNNTLLSFATEPRPKSPVVVEQVQTPVTDSVRGNPPLTAGTSKTETKKQKNGKSSKKGAASRMKQPGLKTDSLSEAQLVEPRPAENGRSEKELPVQTKVQSRLKATVEEVSDKEASSRLERAREIPKQQASVRVDHFAEPRFTPSSSQVESTADENWGRRFAQAAVPSQPESWRKREKSFSANQRNLSDFEELSGYRFAVGDGIEQKRGGAQDSAGSAEETHAVWKPPVVFDDDSGDDHGGQGLVYSLAFGGKASVDNTSHVPRAEGGWPQMVPNMVRTSETKNTGKKDPGRNRNVSTRGEGRVTGKWTDQSKNNTAELGVVDDGNAWETAMMQKFFGLAQTSS